MTHSVVVGGAGFVGSWVVEEILKDSKSRVTIIDNLISSEKWNISADPRVTFVEGSAADFATFEKIVTPIDTLYQLACFHGNQSSIVRPLDDLENGLKTTLTTLEWVATYSPRTRVVYSGAGCAVAEKTWDTPTPVQEVNITSLLHDSPYSISKVSGEMYCLYYAYKRNLDVVRVRFQNVYGPREILGAGVWRGSEHSTWRNVIPTFIWKALHNLPLEVFGDATRDFIFVQDIASGVRLASEHGMNGEVYNLATGVEVSIKHLAETIKKLTKSKSEIVYRHPRVWDSSGRRFGSTVKSSNEIHFEATTDILDGLDKTIRWTVINKRRIALSIEKMSQNF